MSKERDFFIHILTVLFASVLSGKSALVTQVYRIIRVREGCRKPGWWIFWLERCVWFGNPQFCHSGAKGCSSKIKHHGNPMVQGTSSALALKYNNISRSQLTADTEPTLERYLNYRSQCCPTDSYLHEHQ